MNAAYSRGGIDLQVSSVEDFLGIKISHYVTVNYEAVKELVDAIGGVEVYTPAYKYTDPSTIPVSYTHLDVYKRQGQGSLL